MTTFLTTSAAPPRRRGPHVLPRPVLVDLLRPAAEGAGQAGEEPA